MLTKRRIWIGASVAAAAAGILVGRYALNPAAAQLDDVGEYTRASGPAGEESGESGESGEAGHEESGESGEAGHEEAGESGR